MQAFSSVDYQKAFEKHFTINRYPEPSEYVVLADKVSKEAGSFLEKRGLKGHDLIEHPVESLIWELRKYLFSGIFIRGEGDKAFVKAMEQDPENEILSRLRHKNGLEIMARLGNGVDLDCQKAFEEGIVVVRTPRANAISVRIWQDLQLLLMLAKDKEEVRENNPVWLDNKSIKEKSSVKKFDWDMSQLSEMVNPESRDFDEMPERAKKCAEYLRGKKVAILGLGMIGREIIAKSPFLREARIYFYDPQNIPIEDERITRCSSKEEALSDADVLIIHMAGRSEEVGEEELILLNKGAIVINNARGEIVNPKALYEALENGQVSQAALDTHYVEGKEINKIDEIKDPLKKLLAEYVVKLRNHPLLIASNHSAAQEIHTQGMNAEDGAEAVDAFVRYGQVIDPMVVPQGVDFPWSAFLQPRSGMLVPRKDIKGYRLATMLLHDGSIGGLLSGVRAAMKDVKFKDRVLVESVVKGMVGILLTSIHQQGYDDQDDKILRLIELVRKGLNPERDLNIKAGNLGSITVMDKKHQLHENSISFEAYDLPEPYKDKFDDKFALEMNDVMHGNRGAIRAYTFKVEPKPNPIEVRSR